MKKHPGEPDAVRWRLMRSSRRKLRILHTLTLCSVFSSSIESSDHGGGDDDDRQREHREIELKHTSDELTFVLAEAERR